MVKPKQITLNHLASQFIQKIGRPKNLNNRFAYTVGYDAEITYMCGCVLYSIQNPKKPVNQPMTEQSGKFLYDKRIQCTPEIAVSVLLQLYKAEREMVRCAMLSDDVVITHTWSIIRPGSSDEPIMSFDPATWSIHTDPLHHLPKNTVSDISVLTHTYIKPIGRQIPVAPRVVKCR